MTFDEYQKQAQATAISVPDPLMEKTVWALGIAGEAGEVVEKWKKIVAYNGGVISDTDLELLKQELGDVIWYVAVLAHSLELSFDEIARLNIAKQNDRKKRGVTKGSGDSR